MAAPSGSGAGAGDRVDLTKEIRDPLTVFYDDDVQVPLPDVKPLSSLEDYADKFLRGKMPNPESPPPAPKPPTPEPPDSKQKGGRRKELPTVLTVMAEDSFHNKGPYNLLFRAVRDRTRIKVWTRNHSQVRSILTGFLHAYDRHMNLAMADVDEILLLPASIKTPILHPVVRRGPRTPPGSPGRSSGSEGEGQEKTDSIGSEERRLQQGGQEERQEGHSQEHREGPPEEGGRGERGDQERRQKGPTEGLPEALSKEPQEGRRSPREDSGEVGRTDEPMESSRTSTEATPVFQEVRQAMQLEDPSKQKLKNNEAAVMEVVLPTTVMVVESSETGRSERSEESTHPSASRVPRAEGGQVESSQQTSASKNVLLAEELEKGTGAKDETSASSPSSSLPSSSVLTALLASARQMQSLLPEAYQTRRYQGAARMDEIMKYELKLPSWASEVKASRSMKSGSRSSKTPSRTPPGTPPSGRNRVVARPSTTTSAPVKHKTRSSSSATPTGSPPSPTALVIADTDATSWKLREIDVTRHEQKFTRTKTKKKPRRRTSVVPEEQLPREADDPTSPLKDPRRPSPRVDPSVPCANPIEEEQPTRLSVRPQPLGLVSLKTDKDPPTETPSGPELKSTDGASSSQHVSAEGVEETRLRLQGVDLGRRNVRSSSEATPVPLDENEALTSMVVGEPAGLRDLRSSSLLRRASIQSLDPGPDPSRELTCTEIGEDAKGSSVLEDPRRRLEVAGDAEAAIGATEPEPQVPLDSSRGTKAKRTSRERRRARQVLTPRKRHVNQLFVRGDNVVSVSLFPV